MLAARAGQPDLTVVLDDDPTGTQSAADVAVLLEWGLADLIDVFSRDTSVYLQTNSRALDGTAAAELAEDIRAQVEACERRLSQRISVVLRGDSTLRGHVFSETAIFFGDETPVLFTPAFPAGGRTTIDSIHRVLIDGISVPVGETEFAADPVFGFGTSNLLEFVADAGRHPISVALADLRTTRGRAVTEALVNARADDWVIPDAVTDEDIRHIYRGFTAARNKKDVVARAAAPFAAMCAGAFSPRPLRRPLSLPLGPVLLVCGSHTGAAEAQLDHVAATYGWEPTVVPTAMALSDPIATVKLMVGALRDVLNRDEMAILSTERRRLADHNTLAHGERVMAVLAAATREIASDAGIVITKGGITGAEIARTGLGARAARVRGQVLDGVSLWDFPDDPSGRVQIVIPGNVGGPSLISETLAAIPQLAR